MKAIIKQYTIWESEDIFAYSDKNLDMQNVSLLL